MKKLTMLDVAKVCHEANRAFCEGLGDTSQLPWGDAPDWQKLSAVHGVVFHLEKPERGPADSHENWLKEKLEGGWKYGPVKNPTAKEHPCCVPFHELPLDQQRKDHLFTSIVRALAPLVE